MEHAAHLRHELHTSGLQELDLNMRRAAYIGESVELLNVFEFAHPLQKLASLQTFTCSFYGSNLYDLYGPSANRLYRAWQVSVRDAWCVSRQTRTYLVDHLLSGSFPHVRELILRRHVKFVQGLVFSMNPVISGLSYWGVRTRQSTTGRNVANMQNEFQVDPLNCLPWDIKVSKRDIPENYEQNLELLDNLLSTRATEYEPDIVSNLTMLIDMICAE